MTDLYFKQGLEHMKILMEDDDDTEIKEWAFIHMDRYGILHFFFSDTKKDVIDFFKTEYLNGNCYPNESFYEKNNKVYLDFEDDFETQYTSIQEIITHLEQCRPVNLEISKCFITNCFYFDGKDYHFNFKDKEVVDNKNVYYFKDFMT